MPCTVRGSLHQQQHHHHHHHEPAPLSMGVCAICLGDRLTQLASLRSCVNQPLTNSHQHEATASGVCAICLEDRLAQLASSRSAGVNQSLSLSPSPSGVNQPLFGPPPEISPRSGVNCTLNRTLLRPGGVNEPLAATNSDRPGVKEPLSRTLAAMATMSSARPGVNEPLYRPRTTMGSDLPGVNESSCRPRTTMGSNRPGVNESSCRPQTTMGSNRPGVNESSCRPRTTMGSDRPGVTATGTITDISSCPQPGDGYLGRSRSLAVGKTLAELLQENRPNPSKNLLTALDKSKSVSTLTGSCQSFRGRGGGISSSSSSSLFLTWLKPSPSSLSFRFRRWENRKLPGISAGKPLDAEMGDAGVCISRSSSKRQQTASSSGARLGSSFALIRRSKSRGTVVTDICQSSRRQVDGNQVMETDTSTCFTEWSEEEFTGQLSYNSTASVPCTSTRNKNKNKNRNENENIDNYGKNNGNYKNDYKRRGPGSRYGWANGLPRPVRRVLTLLLIANNNNNNNNKGGQEEEEEVKVKKQEKEGKKKESGDEGEEEESMVLESCFCTTSISCLVYMHHHH